MRAIAIIILVIALALAVALIIYPGARSSKPDRAESGQRDQRQTIAQQQHPDNQPPTNNNPPQQGFYMGKGDQRVYVDYTTSNAVLQSFIQSVMTDNSNPTVRGREIFLKLCAICHQSGGEGKDGVAPPLAGSEWVQTQNGNRMVRIVLNGLTGPVQVAGRTWNLAMPPWRENLNDDQIAVVLTYVRTQLGDNHAGPVTTSDVAAIRKTAARPKPETADELLQVSDP